MLQVSPYLTFNGTCRQAMTFYKDCLDGDLQLLTVGETPVGAGCPDGTKNEIMHACLSKDGLHIMASDMVGKRALVNGNNFALSLNCTSEEQIHSLFNALSNGGEITEPVKMQFWGDLFGVLTDQFGICWMLNFQPSMKP